MSGLSVRRVQWRYPGGAGVETGPLSFGAGQVTALLGPNGAGKSTLIKALAGIGSGQVDGLTVAGETLDRTRLRARKIAYLSQTRTGPALASVRDVIALGRFPFGGQDDERRVDTVIDALGLAPFEARAFGTLSGGEQARVLLARALAVDAPVLLADEPTASLDPYYALRIMAALRDEAKRGCTVIVSLHDLSLAERFCDQALILDDGHVASQGVMPAALNAEILRHVFRVSRGTDGFAPLP